MSAQERVAQRFARNMAALRKRAAISQEELGFRADLHRTEVGRLESGSRLARIDTLVKLAGSLEVEPGELLNGIDWSPGATRAGSFLPAKER